MLSVHQSMQECARAHLMHGPKRMLTETAPRSEGSSSKHTWENPMIYSACFSTNTSARSPRSLGTAIV